MEIGKLWASLGLDVSEFKKGMAQAQASMQRAGQQMKSTGKTLTAAVTLPLAAIGGVAFKASKDFESSMSKITGLVGIAGDQVDEWKNNLIAMAPALGKSPQELADAMFFITSAGQRGTEALDTLTIAAKASTAGLGETKTIADLVTSAMTAYGSENLNAKEATDILVASVREGKAEASELAGVMGQLLPVASDMGVGFDQIGAAIASMTRSGTNASEATTQLRAIMVGLMSPSQQAEKALTDMRTSSAELREMIGSKGLFSTLKKLKNLTGEYGKEMSEIFPNVRALSGALDLMGSNSEENEKIFKALTDTTGALDNAFDAATQTAEYRLNKSMATMKTAFTTIGGLLQSTILPVLEKLSEKFNQLAQWLSNLNDTQKKWVVGLGTVVTALGPVLVIFGTLMTNVLPGIIKGITGIGKAFKWLKTIMMANPILLITTALVAVGIAFATLAKKTNMFSTAQSRANKAVGKMNAEFQTQKRHADDMIDKLDALNSKEKLSNAEKVEQKRLINEINSKYSEHLGYQITDITDSERLAEAKQKINDALRDNILIKQSEAQKNEIVSKSLERQQKMYGKIDKELEKLGYDVQSRVDLIGQMFEKAEEGNYNVADLFGDPDELDSRVGATANRITSLLNRYQGSIINAKKETDALDKQLQILLKGIEGGGGGGQETPKDPEYLKQLEWEAQLIGKTTAEQKAMNIAKQNSIKIDSAEYQVILEKVKALEAEKNKLKEGNNVQQERQQAIQKMLSDMDFEISLLDKSTIEQEALTLARQHEIEVSSELYEQIVARVTALHAEKQVTNDTAKATASYNEDLELQTLLLGKTAAESQALNFAHQNGIQVIDETTGKYTKQFSQILKNTQAYYDLAEAMKNKEALKDNVDNILEGLQTEDEAIAMSYDNRIAILRNAIDQEIGDKTRLKDAIVQLEKEKADAIAESTQQQTQSLNQYQQLAQQAIVSMTAAIGTAIVDQEKGFAAMATLVIDSISKIINILLLEAAAAILTGETIKFGAIGLITAAIGIAALKAMWSKYQSENMQGLATGGYITNSGQFLVGEQGPEIVSLKAGSAVTPNHMLGQSQGGILETRISGRDLQIILNRNAARERRY